MKLIDLLKITDDMTNIVIWDYNTPDDGEPLYEGPIFNVPWTVTEMHLVRGLENNEFMLSIRNSEEGDALLIVSVSDSPLSIEGAANEGF